MRRAPRKTKVSRLSTLAGELRVSIGKLTRRVRAQVRPGDFTAAQKSVVIRLERDGPATVSALAKAESVRPQSMRITVASLEKLGLVRGERDPADGRQTFFSLTAACHETLEISRAAREDWLVRALQAQLAPHEREQLAATVDFLNRLAEF